MRGDDLSGVLRERRAQRPGGGHLGEAAAALPGAVGRAASRRPKSPARWGNTGGWPTGRPQPRTV